MKARDLSCWKCGATLEGVPMPISRLSECLSCRSELHVCRMCEFYDTSVAQDCREPMAEEIKDKTRANFCEHFYPSPELRPDPARAVSAPSAELDALFGGKATDSGEAPAPEHSAARDTEDLARQQLEGLFGKPESDS
jgi:hypothetical protein